MLNSGLFSLAIQWRYSYGIGFIAYKWGIRLLLVTWHWCIPWPFSNQSLNHELAKSAPVREVKQ